MAEAVSQNNSATKFFTNSSSSECRSRTCNIPCRFFALGRCRKNASCPFKHGQGPATLRDERHGQGHVLTRDERICWYFKMGNCKYGDGCRYSHTTENTKESSNVSPRNKNDAVRSSDGNAPLRNSRSIESNNARKKVSASHAPDIGGSTSKPSSIDPDRWIEAPEFVPGVPFNHTQLSYSGAAKSGLDATPSSEGSAYPDESGPGLPPHEDVHRVHIEICDYCGEPILDEQVKLHKEECMKEMELDMELSFAIQRSKDRTCGICMEVILDKENPVERRFGLLSACDHCFCLSCIRKWRQAKQFDRKVVRACPECRVPSDFVTPSKYWAEDPDDKKKMIEGYKQALRNKPCCHFDQGRGECPFNDKCFYKHEYPDGRPASPRRRPRRVQRDEDADVELMHQILLWDYLDSRDSVLEASLLDVIEELYYTCSDTESESDEDYGYLYLNL